MTDAVSAALRLCRGRRLAYAAERRRFRLLRQSQPAQPQIAALGRELRRARQFRPPRAFGGLGPAIHTYDDITRSQYAANRQLRL